MMRIIPGKLQNCLLIVLLSFTVFIISPAFCQGSDNSVDVLHYAIYLDNIDIPSATISGHTVLTLTAADTAVTRIHIDLLRLKVDKVLINGSPHHFDYNNASITLNLDSPLDTNDTMTVDVHYHGSPHIEKSGWGGFHFTGKSLAYNLGIALNETPHNFGKAWFACIDNFTERATYDFYITVNPPLLAVCNGFLVSSTPQPNNTVVYHWRLEQQIPAYLASVAISDYAHLSDTYRSQYGIIPTDIYVAPADTARARKSFINLNAVLATFEQRFGPYRWPKAGFVGTTIGAMEHATNIAYPANSIDGTLNDEYLYAHELSHAWFGNLVTCHSAADIWINEGWAVFCESIAAEGVYGKSAYKNNIRKKLDEVLHRTHITDKGYRAIYGIPEQYTYGSTVYDKGGIVVHSLRGYLGDSIFFRTVQSMLDTFSFRDISTTQMRDFITANTGINVSDFFEAWVFSPGFPHFSVDSFAVSQMGTDYEVSVFLRQRLKAMPVPANSNRIEIGFLGNDWQSATRTMQFSGLNGKQTFMLPFNPAVVMADPEEKIGDAAVEYSEVIKTTGILEFPNAYFTLNTMHVKDSAFIRITHNWIAPDALTDPDLTLSPSRYWMIDGLFPEGFKAGGDFYYSRFNDLDDALIQNNLDSVVLLYRPNVKSDWHITPFFQKGITQQGKLQVDQLMRGEYTLAIRRNQNLQNHKLNQQKKTH